MAGNLPEKTGEIRAGHLSRKTLKRFSELKDYFGVNTQTGTMDLMVNILHLHLLGSSRVALFRKAAKLVSANERLSRELQPSEVQRVSIQKGLVLVWARHQGEPYKISEEVWEQGIND